MADVQSTNRNLNNRSISSSRRMVNVKAFDLTQINFKLERSPVALIVATVLMLTALYVRFW